MHTHTAPSEYNLSPSDRPFVCTLLLSALLLSSLSVDRPERCDLFVDQAERCVKNSQQQTTNFVCVSEEQGHNIPCGVPTAIPLPLPYLTGHGEGELEGRGGVRVYPLGTIHGGSATG